MQVTFVVRVSLDAAFVADLVARQHKSAGEVIAEIAGDVECRLCDAARFKDGVRHIDIELTDPLPTTRPAA